MVIDGFMDENGLTPLSQKRKLVPPNTEGPMKFEILSSLSYKVTKNIFSFHKKNTCGWVVYTMENKDKNTDYQTVVRVGVRK